MFARLDTSPEADASKNPIPWRVASPDLREALAHMRLASGVVASHAATLISLTLRDRLVISKGTVVQHGVATQNGALEGMLRQFMTGVMGQWLEIGYCLLRIAEDGRFVVVPDEGLTVKFQYRRDDELWARIEDTAVRPGATGPDARLVKNVLCYVLDPPTPEGFIRSRFAQCLDAFGRLEVLSRAAMRSWVGTSFPTAVVQSAGADADTDERRRDAVVLGDFSDVTQTRLTEAQRVRAEAARMENEALQKQLPATPGLLGPLTAPLNPFGGLSQLQERRMRVLHTLVDRSIVAPPSHVSFEVAPSGLETKQVIPAQTFPNLPALQQHLSDEIRVVFGLPSHIGAGAHKTNMDTELAAAHQRSTIQGFQSHLSVVGSVMLNFAHAPATFARLIREMGAAEPPTDASDEGGPGEEDEEDDEKPRRRRRTPGQTAVDIPSALIEKERWAVTFVKTLHVEEVRALHELGALHGEEGARLLSATFGIPLAMVHPPAKPEPPAVPKAGTKKGAV